MRRSQRRVFAKVHLHRRRKPAFFLAVAFLNKKRRLRQIILRRNVLHQIIRKPRLQRHNRRRIPAKRHARKRINLKNFELHIVFYHRDTEFYKNFQSINSISFFLSVSLCLRGES